MTLGFSPCPNDTFIFDALVNNKIDTNGLRFEVVLEDVQTLNRWAIEGRLDISKISYGVLPLLLNEYRLLDAGGALGMGVGPLLISSSPGSGDQQLPADAKVLIPGENTTAHMLFTMAYPECTKKEFVLFSEIEKMLLDGRAEYGVIIHENRFTYQRKGLIKIKDLGDHWEKQTHAPVPLGGIVIRRHTDMDIARAVNRLIRESIRCAFAQYPALAPYVREHSQEMEEDIMRQHIDLYVNDFSSGLGDDGRKAVRTMLDIYAGTNGLSTIKPDQVFMD